MTFAVFRCCPTPLFLKAYETSTDAVLRSMGGDYVDIKEFNCCGYPLRNLHFKAYLLSSARNLSLAEERKADIITLCNCCYGSLKQAKKLLDHNGDLREELNRTLRKERLAYQGNVEVRHVLDVLFNDIGLEAIREKVARPFTGLRVAAHYGCQLLRPSRITSFDSPLTPSIFDRLIELTGAESVDWSTKIECCGASLIGSDDALSADLAVRKLKDASRSGAALLCVSCVYCQLQFERVHKPVAGGGVERLPIPSILYTQLLGICLGLEPSELGFNLEGRSAQEIFALLG